MVPHLVENPSAPTSYIPESTVVKLALFSPPGEWFGCAPPVGAYDPKADSNAVAVGFDKSDRFKAPKDVGGMPNASFNTSNLSVISCPGVTPGKKLSQFSTSTPNLSIQEKKAKQVETKKVCDNSQVKELEREIKKLLQERVEQDKVVSRKEEELRKLDGKLHHAMSEKSALQAKLAALEKQLTDLQKGNDVLKNKIMNTESSLKKQENLQAEVNSLKTQISVKEGEATRLRQELDAAVGELLDCLYTSLETATALSHKGKEAGNLEDLRANNLGIMEKLKLANLKVKMLRDEVTRAVEEVKGEVSDTRQAWEGKYSELTAERDSLAITVSRAEESLAASEAARQVLERDSDALLTQVETMKATVTEMEAEKHVTAEKIRHLKELLAGEKSSRKVESQTAFESSAEKAELQEKIEQLEEGNEVLNTNIRLMTEKYHCLEIALAEEQSCNEGQLTKLEAELTLCQSDNEKLQTELLDLQEKNRDFIKALHEQQTTSSQKINCLKQDLAESNDKVTARATEIDQLNVQITELLADIESYKQQIQEGHSRENELKKTVVELESRVAELQSEISDLQQGAVLHRDELQAKLHHTKLQYEELQQQHARHVSESTERVSELESRLEAGDEEKTALLTQISTLKLDGDAYRKLKTDFDRYKEEVYEKEEETKKHLEETLQSKASVEINCRELEERMKELSLRSEEVCSERDGLVAEVDQVRGEMGGLSATNLQLTKKLCQCEEARDRFRSENSELEQELEKAKNHREALLVENEELEETLSVLRGETEELKSQRNDLGERLLDLSEEMSTLEEKCSHLEAMLDDKSADNEELAASRERLQAELVKTVEVKQAISDKFVQSEARLEQTEKQLAEVRLQETMAQEALENSESKRKSQAEMMADLEEQLLDRATKMSTLTDEKQNLETELHKVESEKSEICSKFEELVNRINTCDAEMLTVKVENEKLHHDLEKLSEERSSLFARSSELEETVRELKAEKEELLCERDKVRKDLTTATEEIQNMLQTYSIEKNNSCTAEEKEALMTAKASLEKQLEERTTEVKLHMENCELMEQRLIESEHHREEIASSVAELEVGFEHRMEEEHKKLSQIREQYEQQILVLREQLDLGIPRDEFDMLQVEAERWKMKYEDLLVKVEPFLEQINAFEAEKEALLGRNKDAQNEVDKLSRDYAKLLGHQNQKQKIKHILKLKEESNTLRMELTKAREQLGKNKRTIQRLEERLNQKDGKGMRFDPSKAFQHSKENMPATPPSQKLAGDPPSGRPRPSPLANRNARFYSPIQNGIGQRL